MIRFELHIQNNVAYQFVNLEAMIPLNKQIYNGCRMEISRGHILIGLGIPVPGEMVRSRRQLCLAMSPVRIASYKRTHLLHRGET